MIPTPHTGEILAGLREPAWSSGPCPECARLRERLDEAVRLIKDARDSVEECVQEHAASWGERLMHKQLDAITNLREIDAFLERIAAEAKENPR